MRYYVLTAAATLVLAGCDKNTAEPNTDEQSDQLGIGDDDGNFQEENDDPATEVPCAAIEGVSSEAESTWRSHCPDTIGAMCCDEAPDLTGEACTETEEEYYCIGETEDCAGRRHRCINGVWSAGCCYCTTTADSGYADTCHPGIPDE